MNSISYWDRQNGIISEPVSIVMPVWNEAEAIESVIAEMVEVVYRYLPAGSEFLIQEGGSTDGTREILTHLRQRWPFLDIVSAANREGFVKASRALYQRARAPLIFFLDSDGQCVASEFWKLAAKIGEFDCVLGTKQIRYDPLLRRLASFVFNSTARFEFGFEFTDINFGFRLMRREAACRCLEACHHMPSLLNSEMTIAMYRYGYRVGEVAVHHRPRVFGMSRGIEPGSLLKESWRAFVALHNIRRDDSQPWKRGIPARWGFRGRPDKIGT